MAKKPVKRGSADKFFVPNVEEPFELFIGKDFTLMGNWWPNCDQKDRFSEFKMLVLAVERDWKATETSTPTTAFKAGIIHNDDPDFTQPGKVKDTHFWYMTISQFSLAYKNYEQKKKAAAAADEDAPEALQVTSEDQTGVSSSSNAALPTDVTPKKKSPVWAFFKKVREHTTDGKGKKGFVCTCIIDPRSPSAPVEIVYVDSTTPLWKHLETFYPEMYEQVSAVKHSRADENGIIPYTFDNPKSWEQNCLLMKVVQKKALPLSFGEDALVKTWIRKYDEKAAPVGHETLARMNLAHQAAHSERKAELFSRLTEEGVRVSTQFDM